MITIMMTLWVTTIIITIKSKLISINSVETYTPLVTAESAIVVDLETGEILFEKNGYQNHLTASIAKVLTCITAIEKIDLDKYIYIDERVFSAVGSRIYLEVGDLIKVEDLLYGLMLQSGNDAALFLAYAYSDVIDDFICEMNNLCARLNLKTCTFTNPSGLDEVNSNYASCYDMAMITKYAMNNATFRKIIITKKYQINMSSGKTLNLHNKHRLLQVNEKVIGGKTGYTKKAGRTLITCFKGEVRNIIVVTMDAYNDWLLHEELFYYYDK